MRRIKVRTQVLVALAALGCAAWPAAAQDQAEFFSPIAGSNELSPAETDPTAPPKLARADVLPALAETYRECLERLCEEERATLLSVVADLEVAALADQPERRLPRLGQMELVVIRRLAKQDPEILVPVFQLHHDLYLEHRDQRNWLLLHHSMAMVRELAHLYVKSTGSTGSRIMAARILTSLGGHMQAGGQTRSVALFEDALDLEPENEAALLGMAAHFEKRGAPPEHALRYLGRLTTAYPKHREGRLRTAVNLLRLERDDEAVALFKALLKEDAIDWAHSLAAQELARHFSHVGRLGDGIDVLEKARTRAPADQKLAIQLSFFYDRNRQSFDATQLALEVSKVALPSEDPPRGRYNKWPHTALDHDRAELRELAASREALLVRLIGGERPSREAEVNR